MYGDRAEQRRAEWHMAAEHVAEHSNRGVLEHCEASQQDVHVTVVFQAEALLEHPPADIPVRQA